MAVPAIWDHPDLWGVEPTKMAGDQNLEIKGNMEFNPKVLGLLLQKASLLRRAIHLHPPGLCLPSWKSLHFVSATEILWAPFHGANRVGESQTCYHQTSVMMQINLLLLVLHSWCPLYGTKMALAPPMIRYTLP